MPTIRGDVDFINVSFHYADDPTPILEHINLHADARDKRSRIVGETGAGKSTLVKLLSRFYDVTEGAILIDGIDIRTVTQRFPATTDGRGLARPVSVFSGTVRENIGYGARDAPLDAAMIEAAKAVGAHDFIMKLEQGLRYAGR
jgi:ATP-binding cassette subfamily B multidrug efflux pump